VTFHQFKIFIAVARHKNLTRASEELHITQPCISQQMRLLQEEYGSKLYERTAKGVELTEAGERFLTAVKPILDQVKSLKTSSAQYTPANEPERLVVGGTHSTSTYLVPSFLSHFKKINRRVEIDFRTNNGPEIERLILKQKIEIAITTRMPNSPRIMAEPLRRERLVPVISRHHRLARAQTISLRDLERTPFLIRASGTLDGTTATRLKYLADENGINITIAIRFESAPAIKEAIHRNLGIGIVHEDVVRYDVRHGDFKIIDIPWLKVEKQSYIIYLNDRALSKTATVFLELLRRRSQFKKDINQDHLCMQHTPANFATSVPQLQREMQSGGFSA
jgi:DNA-binding transcriptional LysR family regulator